MAIQKGTVLLFNTKPYPFNNSQATVALSSPLSSSDYVVNAIPISSSGEVGSIVISGKARNGFKISFTGSASQADIFWSIEV